MIIPANILGAVAEAASKQSSPIAIYPDTVEGQVLCIDGDFLAYWASAVAKEDGNLLRFLITNKVLDLKAYTGSTAVEMHLTTAWSNKADRYAISSLYGTKLYQTNRKGASKPALWQLARDILEGYDGHMYTPVLWGDREADDGVYKRSCEQRIAIASKDKDFRQFNGLHINWDTFELVDVRDANGTDWLKLSTDGKTYYGYGWFLMQMLQGDTADHIAGVGKIEVNGKQVACGEVRARNAIIEWDTPAEAEVAVIEAYIRRYGHEMHRYYMAQQALLLRFHNNLDVRCTDIFGGYLDKEVAHILDTVKGMKNAAVVSTTD